jgi:hypothetical protein
VSYKLTVRVRGKVERDRHQSLDTALTALEQRADALAATAYAEPEGGGIMRKIAPVQQVVGRLELAGPRRLRAGLDVRGDGSTEAWTGRVRREILKQQDGETAMAALRRSVS